MLLNFSAPKLAPNIVASPQSNIDVNATLGLTPSNYKGLQKVGDTGYFYGNNRMYEPYTAPPAQPLTIQQLMQPSGGPMGSGISGGPMYGYQPPSLPSYESMTIDGQEFRTVSPDIQGFTKMALDDDKYQKDSVYEYSPSMAYLYANAPRPKPLPTPNVMSFLSTPTAIATPTGSYGAGRFLDGGLLGSPINYGIPKGETASDS